jgi:hypothetical protein
VYRLFDDYQEENPNSSLKDVITSIPLERLETTLEECPAVEKIVQDIFGLKFTPIESTYVALHGDKIDETYKPCLYK